MMGIPVDKLSEVMSHKEMLYHLDDLQQEPALFDMLNNLFAVLNKNILNCSMASKDQKLKVKASDFLLKIDGDSPPKKSKKELHEIARANKYKGLVI